MGPRTMDFVTRLYSVNFHTRFASSFSDGDKILDTQPLPTSDGYARRCPVTLPIAGTTAKFIPTARQIPLAVTGLFPPSNPIAAARVARYPLPGPVKALSSQLEIPGPRCRRYLRVMDAGRLQHLVHGCTTRHVHVGRGTKSEPKSEPETVCVVCVRCNVLCVLREGAPPRFQLPFWQLAGIGVGWPWPGRSCPVWFADAWLTCTRRGDPSNAGVHVIPGTQGRELSGGDASLIHLLSSSTTRRRRTRSRGTGRPHDMLEP